MTTLGPATSWGSVIYAGEAVHPETLRRVHVLGFQARVVNDSRRANAVVLPVLSAAPIGPANLIDVASNALEDMAATLRQMDPLRGFERPDTRVLPRGRLAVAFTRPEGVVRALGALEPDLRPPVDRKLFAHLAERYPGAQLALCCWTGSLHVEPLVLWYEPLYPKALFLPAPVDGDVTLVVGSSVRPFGVRVQLSAPRADVSPFLPAAVWGQVKKGAHVATDYQIEIAPLRQLENVARKHDLHPRLDPKLWAIRFEPRDSEAPR